jgi:uncharacterized protein YhbP (UPF0306 family)
MCSMLAVEASSRLARLAREELDIAASVRKQKKTVASSITVDGKACAEFGF